MAEKTKHRLSLSKKIFIWFAAFTILFIVLLWVFQSFLLDDIYQYIKTKELQRIPDTVASEYSKQDDLTEFVFELSIDKDSCIMIINRDGGVLYNAHANRDCIIHRIANSTAMLRSLYLITEENGGTYFERPEIDPNDHNYIASKIFDFDGESYCIIANSSVMPLKATVTTLTYQLIFITIIMLIFAVIFSIIIPKSISKPIKKINESAKELSKGNYDIRFSTDGIKEVAELGETLNYATDELSKTDRYRKELLANISHDMRTPLTMITGYGEMMRDIPGENNAENIQIIIDESKRLTVLVNDALDLSKMESGAMTPDYSVFSITDLLKDSVSRVSKMLEHKGYTIELNASENAFVNADRVKIEQVIYNLLTNAVNYTGESNKVIVNQIIHDNKVRIEFRDFGEGIPAEEYSKIWDRYYKIDKNHKRAVAGSGLGLYIVKNILEMHGAEYGVESEVGSGSTFLFELPLFTDNGDIS